MSNDEILLMCDVATKSFAWKSNSSKLSMATDAFDNAKYEQIACAGCAKMS
jgi:hypothetical protein